MNAADHVNVAGSCEYYIIMWVLSDHVDVNVVLIQGNDERKFHRQGLPLRPG